MGHGLFFSFFFLLTKKNLRKSRRQEVEPKSVFVHCSKKLKAMYVGAKPLILVRDKMCRWGFIAFLMPFNRQTNSVLNHDNFRKPIVLCSPTNWRDLDESQSFSTVSCHYIIHQYGARLVVIRTDHGSLQRLIFIVWFAVFTPGCYYFVLLQDQRFCSTI